MPDLASLVRQHAETSRLFGVDFVPAYRGAAGPPPAVAPGPPPPVPAAPAPPLTALVEPKPAPVRAPVTFDIPAFTPGDRDAARRALDDLRARYEREAPHRAFVTAHTNIVFGEGDPQPRLVFIGEAPGEEEDRTGRPFVGRSGELLTKMIGAMGLSREQVYICNVLKTRPPNNATPTPREIELCAPFLRAQVGILNPEVIVTLGLPATTTILACSDSMSRLRGRWGTYRLDRDRSVPVMPTYHPAYLLRNYTAEARGKVWSDLRLVMDRLGLAAPARPREADRPWG